MDKIILGILMLKRLTSYEIRNIIRQNYKAMCSDSLGAIQVTLKKLFASGLITCNEFVEKSVNKKVYSITDVGRGVFMEWLETPTDLSKGKNMELGKLLLMGLVPAEKRESLIDKTISMLKEELAYLQEIKKGLKASKEKEQFISFVKQNSEYSEGIAKATNNQDMTEIADAIGTYEALTLQLGIDTAKYQVEWLENLKADMKLGGNI